MFLAANEPVGELRGDEADLLRPGGGAKEPRLSIHRGVSGLLRVRQPRVDLHGAYGHVPRQAPEALAEARARSNPGQSQRSGKCGIIVSFISLTTVN